MKITPSLKKQIEKDILICENHYKRQGSQKLYSELVSRYSLIDEKFKDNLSTIGKVAAIGEEFDYRPELRAIVSKLKMYLVLDESSDSPRSTLKKLIDDGKPHIAVDLLDIMRPHNGAHDIYHISGGADYEKWVQDVNKFNERYLKKHPSYLYIKEAIEKREERMAEKIQGAIESVYEDELFWQNNSLEKQEERDTVMYDVFISHANKDKATYVNRLKKSLDKLNIKIFYDKDSLVWGDDWKRKILEGVEKSEFAIFVISENFFDREWTEKELLGFFKRQNESKQKVVLPILHNITISQLQEKYPFVADIQAIDSSRYTCDEIALMFAAQLIKRLKA